jgi:cytoskeleton protein RodZ
MIQKRDRTVSLFQRITTPFNEMAEDDSVQPHGRTQAVGTLLRERREELGFDLDAIGEALRIKPIYLAALEQGRAQDLPGAAYAIGFIRSYAELLDLDSERILESYKAECADVHARPDLSLPVPLDARSLPRGPILLVGVILAACGYGTWYYLSTGERSRPERVAAVPAELQRAAQGTAAASLAGDPPAPVKPAPAPASGDPALSPAPRFGSGLLSPQGPAPAPAVPAAGSPGPGLVASPAVAALPRPAVNVPPAGGETAREAASARIDARIDATGAPAGDAGAKPGGHIDIRALADCWIQVRSGEDQSLVFSRVLKAGETYRVPRAGLVLRTGNAGALALVVDGKPAPAIGGVGMQRRNVTLDPQALLAGIAVRG